MRSILSRCVERAPSVLLLDNLDTLAKKVVEHAHDGEYYNRVSDVIQHLIGTYTASNAVTIIATISSKNNLNQRLYTSRGQHLFQKLYKVPELQKVYIKIRFFLWKLLIKNTFETFLGKSKKNRSGTLRKL